MTVAWAISDVDKKKVKTGSQNYSFGKAGEEHKVSLPLEMEELGWYQLDISVEDDKGRTLLTHPASFALLGKDRRQAKYDSPYGTWWWGGTHGTESDLSKTGPLMFKAGLRKAGWIRKYSDADLAPWYITKTQISYALKRYQRGLAQDPEKALASTKKAIDAELEKNPHADEILIFHESGPAHQVPGELLGLEFPEDLKEKQKSYANILNIYGKFIRENYPQLKIVVGNHNESAGAIAAILRSGGNPDYIDYIGIEAATQGMTPEKLRDGALQGMHIAKDIAKVLSGRELKATGTFEFTYRTDARLGSDRQARFYARDTLISLANEFSKIIPGSLTETTNAYQTRYWGRNGFTKRKPFLAHVHLLCISM